MSSKEARRTAYLKSIIAKARELWAMTPADLEGMRRHVERSWGSWAIDPRMEDSDRWRTAYKSWKSHYYHNEDGEYHRVFGNGWPGHRILADDDPELLRVWEAWKRMYIFESWGVRSLAEFK
jgi:hypothetical protein